ncbi:MAG: TrkH family potassium uptake protein [Candidatus Izemoplasmatales bacterium]|jgi:trk system potassium uptake protein TrkH
MKKRKISPLAVVALSFAGIILFGTILLKLPISTKEGLDALSWVDSLFTSASAVCVTGLSTIPNIAETLSIFGKIVLAILIQIGGLGIVTLAIYVLVVLGIRIGVTERYVLKEALNQHHLGGMIKLVRSIIFTTLIIEGFGFIINFIVFIQDFSFINALGHAAFHTISSFNNAGFDILGATSLQNYSNNLLLNINTMVMIVIGGIGFIVIRDIIEKKSWKNLSLYSKIVLKTTFLLIVIGTLVIKLFEYENISWLEAVFTSVTTRTAGFSTVNISTFSYTTLVVIMIFMFVGASPNSTGGGIKTTTLYVMFKSITSFLTGKQFITHKRKIEDQNKNKAFVLAILAFSVTIFMFIIVSLIEAKNTNYNMTFLEVLFETFSAFGTVGLSMGITPYLLPGSKVLLSLLMFIGRLGPITIFGIMNKNWGHPEISHINYAVEKILVG